ncbi:hypothetical protein K435DRAFT_558703, partial [Dendrothele bispora CBS 962.96]
RLRVLIPSDVEWTILEELEPVLEVFLNRTKQFSQSGVPLLHEVIPAIDKLTEVLGKVRDNDELNSAVRFAVTKGITMLNKYYGKTDYSDVYRVAMVMHPRFKAEYFRRQDWQPDWVENAIKIARQIWQKDYR